MKYTIVIGAFALILLSACKSPNSDVSQSGTTVKEPSGAEVVTNAPPEAIPRDIYQRPYPGMDPVWDFDHAWGTRGQQ